MRNTLECLATDPVTKRLMQEQRFAEMDVLSWKQTVKEQNRVIERKDKIIEEYRRRFGNLNTSLN